MSPKKVVRPHKKSPTVPHEEPAAGKETLEEAMALETNPAKRLFLILGPGVVTGASDDDPSGIGTYSVTGAQFGYATLWTALFCFPLMTATQITDARRRHPSTCGGVPGDCRAWPIILAGEVG
jgi:hypothetical protein